VKPSLDGSFVGDAGKSDLKEFIEEKLIPVQVSILLNSFPLSLTARQIKFEYMSLPVW
jgi:hypothetical protein